MESQDDGGQHGGSLNPQALSVEDLARVLTASSRKAVTREMIQKSLDNGAPLNPDGTISLVKFAAFLAKEVTSGRTD
jgi:hypothetical protein